MVSPIMNRTLRILSLCTITAFCGMGPAFASGEGWTSDFEAAKKEAVSDKKDILIDITGSDWCKWCIKLDKDVFQQDAFKTGVKDQFVLVELDYPRDKSKLSEATRKQNEELQNKFAARSFPMVLLCDSEGRPYATSTGYKKGGPEKYLVFLEELRAKKAKRNKSFAAAATAQGTEKAKLLIAALNDMGISDSSVANCYSDIVTQIKEADPNDETGYAKAAADAAKKIAFDNEFEELSDKNHLDGMIALLDKNISEAREDKGEKVQYAMRKIMVYIQYKKYDEALRATDDAKAISGNAETAKSLDAYKGRIEAMKKVDATK